MSDGSVVKTVSKQKDTSPLLKGINFYSIIISLICLCTPCVYTCLCFFATQCTYVISCVSIMFLFALCSYVACLCIQLLHRLCVKKTKYYPTLTF